MKRRTREFALEVIAAVDDLPRDRIADHCGRQLLRSGTSTAANYRAACRARSRQEMIAKLGIVEEESDECMFWVDMLRSAKRGDPDRLAKIENEAGQILAIVVASRKTLKANAKEQVTT